MGGGKTRLCSRITFAERDFVIWYEVESKFEEYLCYERADAFVIALLPLALTFGHDIHVKDAPVSEKIIWQLRQIYIPALAKYSNYYKSIEIECSVDSTIYSSFAVGTGFSAGVDSFYTLLKNKNTQTSNYDITHLTFFNVGANGSYGGKEAEDRFYKRISLYKAFVEQEGYQFVEVNSNISEYLMMSYNFTHSFRSMSAVLALQKLFKTYYYSAGYSLKEFSFNPYDSSFFDLLNSEVFSTESLTFFSTGCVESRVEKTEYISQFPETYDLLNVCNNHDTNCRTCEKCIRTMAGLYALGKLELYKSVFDTEYFKKHLTYNMAFVLSKSLDGTVEAKYFSEIVEKMSENHCHIPILSYLLAVPLGCKFIAINLARRCKPLKKWWHRRMNKKQGIIYNDIC